jgi:phenylalanine-4-hydroxylase
MLEQSTAALYDLVDDPSVFIKQNWSSYTADDHAVWGLLYDRRMKELRNNGSHIFLKGADTIGLKRETVPDLAEVNRRLAPPTGWEAVPVSGYIPAKSFFQCLSLRKFPTTVTIRKREQLDYLPEPDIFHDVFGHVPLHADPVFADGQIKVYGSGLISSQGDAANALGPKCDRRPFSLDAVFNQPFEIDHFQDVLFVTESFDQLFQAVEEAGRRIGTIR